MTKREENLNEEEREIDGSQKRRQRRVKGKYGALNEVESSELVTCDKKTKSHAFKASGAPSADLA